jgi:hypothetical protein
MTVHDPEGLPQRQLITGAVIAASAIGATFWWGVHFHVFGSDINLAAHPEQLGLPILIAVAVFGGAYAVSGLAGAIRMVGGFFLLLAGAYLIGVVRRLFS